MITLDDLADYLACWPGPRSIIVGFQRIGYEATWYGTMPDGTAIKSGQPGQPPRYLGAKWPEPVDTPFHMWPKGAVPKYLVVESGKAQSPIFPIETGEWEELKAWMDAHPPPVHVPEDPDGYNGTETDLEAEQHVYSVQWILDIEASNPIEAAKQAKHILMDPDNIATIFTVTDKEGKVTAVDTEYDPPEIVHSGGG